MIKKSRTNSLKTKLPILYPLPPNLGTSYCTRTVTAKQRGKSIFVCTASFQVPAPNSPQHQYPMPYVPHHSTLPSQEELIQTMIDNPKVPESYTKILKLRLQEVNTGRYMILSRRCSSSKSTNMPDPFIPSIAIGPRVQGYDSS